MPEHVVRIAATVAAIASGSRAGSSAVAADAGAVWSARMPRLLREVGAPAQEPNHSAHGFFFEDPRGTFPARRLDEPGAAPSATVDRISTSMLEALALTVERPGHVALGLAGDTVQFESVLLGIGAVLEPAALMTSADPLAAGIRADLGGMPSVSRHTAASSSGMHALVAAAGRVATGADERAFAVAASAADMPLPFPVVELGRGADRDELPFHPDSDGHHYAEGGIGLALVQGRPEPGTLPDDDCWFAIRGWASGSFGTAVVNRHVVAATVERALETAGVPEHDQVFVDLYGRGNPIDDAAELSAIALLRRRRPGVRAGYLKGDAHYTVGAHALRGLVRLVERRRDGAGGTIHLSRNHLVGRSGVQLDAYPEAVRWFVFPSYSVRGDCTVLVVREERA